MINTTIYDDVSTQLWDLLKHKSTWWVHIHRQKFDFIKYILFSLEGIEKLGVNV